MNLYDWLLRAYPRHFRERYADDMRRTFAQDLAASASRGRGSRARFWIFTALHAVWFGTVERLPRGPTMRSFLTFDLRGAIRSLRATPVITGIALLSLALGIGANTALFSILNGLVLKPLPVRAPQELAMLDDDYTNPIWEAVRDRAPKIFDGAFAWSHTVFDLAASGMRDPVEGAFVSGGMFDTLGVSSSVGRVLTVADDTRGGGPDGSVAVISHRLWQRRYNSSTSVLGSKILINRVPFTIVGVMQPGFLGADVGQAADIIVPIADEAAITGAESSLDQRSNWWLRIMVRRKPQQTLEQAAAALNAQRPGIRTDAMPHDWQPKEQESFLKDDWKLMDGATGQSPLREKYAKPLTIIMFVVGAVLLIACANIANLLLARATARRHEMSVRLALGASRWILARQLFTESLLLALAGGVAGLALAQFGSACIVRQLASSISAVTLDMSIDWRVLGFTSAVALGTTMLFGLAPALGMSGVEPNDALKEQSRSVTGDRRFGIRNALVVVQVALSLSLVIGAGLFVRTFTSLATMPLGFDPDPLMIVSIDAQHSEVAPDSRPILYEQARSVAASVRGVRSAAASFMTPLSGFGWNGNVQVDGGPELAPRQRTVWMNAVTSGWFSTYGIHLIAGRDFTSADVKGAENAVVVNETFVKRLVGNQNPIGATFKGRVANPSVDTYRIVGVVADTVYRNARAGVYASVYLPLQQAGRLGAGFVVTANVVGDRAAARRALQSALEQADPRLSYSFRDFSEQVHSSLGQERLVALLSGFFGVLALLLAGLGLYGVTSYSVNRRRSEIAVRMALGATGSGVISMVLGRVTWLVFCGVAIGVGIAMWASKFSETLLFGLKPRDPVTFVAAATVLIATGVLAGWLPARRASRLDPTTVLRD